MFSVRGTVATMSMAQSVRSRLAEVKPRLRGWLHAATAPLVLAAGIVLICLSPSASTRVGSAIYAASAVLLFTVSGVYHRGHWGVRMHAVLKRIDHANIFLLIAGSYTPFTIVLLHGRAQVVLLSIVWGGALLGVAFRVFWNDAPRWLYTPIYIALGWAAIGFIDDFAAAAGAAVLTLIIVGGALYTLGGIVYGFRKPDPFPRWFGFHEVFHSFTIAAFVVHYVGVSIATYHLR